MGHWVFEKQSGKSPRRSPIEAELFKSHQVEEGEYAGNDALVREILQNAVDAKAGGEVVRVRFAVHEADEAPADDVLKHYFARLSYPMAEKGIQSSRHGIPALPCRFLVCEDFGTRGLEGDTSRLREPPPGHQPIEDFFWFWRNIGHSGKTGEDLGRWGLGKTVYRAVSQACCMLGLSARRSDGEATLMGQAVLENHTFQNEEYVPEGYWCDSHEEDSGVVLPITDKGAIDEFRELWRLERREEPGLSVVSPFVHESLKAERILQAVIVNFFARILRGELIVDVVGRELGSIRVDDNSLEKVCGGIDWDGPKRMKRDVAPPIQFARKCLRIAPQIETSIVGEDKVPHEIPKDAIDQGALEKLMADFAIGEPVALRVNLAILPKKGAARTGYADVYLQRREDGDTGFSYYMREGMTITKINDKSRRRGINSLVHIDSGELGDSEGPSHEDWETSAERPNLNWKVWKGRVKFVRAIAHHVVELLRPPKSEPDFDMLSDFFSIERVGGKQRRRDEGDERQGDPKNLGEVNGQARWFQITQRSGGFSISHCHAAEIPAGATLRVSLAYDIPRGDPVKNWSPIDFTLGPGSSLKLNGSSVKASVLRGNEVRLVPKSKRFKFSVTGFDKHRDLFIRVDDLTAEQTVADEDADNGKAST